MNHDEFEKIVMTKLLDGNDSVLENLRAQYASATVGTRRFTGYGFFTQFNISNYGAGYRLNGRIDDVVAKFPDTETYYFILYIKDGKIDALEGFSSLDTWSQKYEDAQVEYCFENRRNYDLC